MKASNLDAVNLKKLNLERSPFTEISVFVNKNKVSPFWGKCKVDKTHTTWAYHNTLERREKNWSPHVGYDSKWIQDHHHSLAWPYHVKRSWYTDSLLKTHLLSTQIESIWGFVIGWLWKLVQLLANQLLLLSFLKLALQLTGQHQTLHLKPVLPPVQVLEAQVMTWWKHRWVFIVRSG